MRINTNLVYELVGNDVVVLDSESSSVMSITGASAAVVKRALAGEELVAKEPGVSELIARGIVLIEEPGLVSRRTLMTTGAAIGAGGVLALSLPGVAMASSSPGLETPVFTNVPGQPYISDDVGGNGEGRSGIGSVQRLTFDFVRFTNRVGTYPDGFEVQWSFSETGDFRSFDELPDDDVYEWRGDKVFVPVGNIDVNYDLLFTVYLRVKAGDQVSPAVKVLFFWGDD